VSGRTIDERPIGRQQWLVAITCGLIVFVDGFDAQAMGYVAPALTQALHISRGVLGPVISSGLVGMMIGALVSGALADRIGRRPVLIRMRARLRHRLAAHRDGAVG
jgi:AAHS family 4-hydroxybenzoate transporter-like MFS transporter